MMADNAVLATVQICSQQGPHISVQCIALNIRFLSVIFNECDGNGLKQDAVSPLVLNSALEYTIMKMQPRRY
jgi:hypothetical protein